MKSLQKLINESFVSEAKTLTVSTKDWDRMLKLVLKGDSGSKVTRAIKNKDKAIARFVAGSRLSGQTELEKSSGGYRGMYGDLGDKALDLGATEEEIIQLFNSSPTPQSYIQKLEKLSPKKLDNRFVGEISSLILKLGFDIHYEAHNGNAITRDGMDAMSRNGRKWTIGYKTTLTYNKEKLSFVFDAITDEGDGPTYYIVDQHGSDNIFDNSVGYYDPVGKRKFLSYIKDVLTKYKDEIK